MYVTLSFQLIFEVTEIHFPQTTVMKLLQTTKGNPLYKAMFATEVELRCRGGKISPSCITAVSQNECELFRTYACAR